MLSSRQADERAMTSEIDAIRRLRRLSIEKLQKATARNYTTPYELAGLYTLAGDNDKAIDWLNRAYADHSYTMVFLKVEPTFDQLRSDPRFRAPLRKVGISR